LNGRLDDEKRGVLNMRFFNKRLAALAFLPLSLGSLTGCVVRAYPGVYVDAGPGYYYDDGFYDGYHVWHPPVYWYYHGGNWERRGFVPHGFVARSRVYRRR
jgi:hypothetical protein